MDSKKYSQIPSSIDIRDSPSKLQSKLNPKDAHLDRKQMPSTESTEPKQRVIKQIVSLDSKKLKDLGIESNILSALTKFNGKKHPFSKNKPTFAVKNVKPSTSTTLTSASKECIPEKSSVSKTISPVPSVVSPKNVPIPSKSPETPAAKKIHVLSNVLLNDTKLDLKDLTVIASSTPIQSKNISNAPKVPQHSQFDTIEDASVEAMDKQCEVPISQHIVHTSSTNTSVLSSQSTKQSHDIEINPVNCEIVELKGFSATDFNCSNSQLKFLRNKVQSNYKTDSPAIKKLNKAARATSKANIGKNIQINKNFTKQPNVSDKTPTEIQTESEPPKESIEVDMEISSEVATRAKAEVETEMKTEAETTKEQTFNALHETSCHDTSGSNAFSNSDTISSERSSYETESDLETLIKEAQRTIENEQNDDNECEIPATVAKKPRLVQKKLIDLLAEHVDKDRIIDEFLDSTINSFRTDCTSPVGGDSSSDTDMSNNNMVIDEAESDEDASNKNDGERIEMPLKLECNETTELQFIENTEVEQQSTPTSRKRKISYTAQVSTKRKKSNSDNECISEQQSESVAKETNVISLNETSIAMEQPQNELLTEMKKGKCLIHAFSFHFFINFFSNNS